MGESGAALVRYIEPSEGAFAITVPEDWVVDSGVLRGAAEARPWYRVRSPGGGAELRVVDPRIPKSYVDPGYAMMAPMLMPGQVLRPYLHAQGFAEEYARFFAQELGAGDFELVARRDAAQIVAEDPRPDARARAQALLAGGCELAGIEFALPTRALRGRVDATNVRVSGPFGLVWSPFVSALVGPLGAWEVARDTLLRIARSYAASEAWQRGERTRSQMQHDAAMESIRVGSAVMRMQAQSGMQAIQAHAQRAKISADAFASIADARHDAWTAQSAVSDEAQRRAVNAVREEVDLYDPASHRVIRGAPDDARRWWTDGADVLVGAQGGENPAPGRLHEAVNLDALPDDHPARRR